MTQTLCHGRYQIGRVFADSGGMGLVYDAVDTLCANNRVLIKTTRYDAGRNAKHFQYTQEEAEKFIRQTRSILEWEKKLIVRFRNEGLNNIPSPNHFFYDRSVTLKDSYGKEDSPFQLSDEILSTEPFLVLELIDGRVLSEAMRTDDFRKQLEVNLLTLARELLTIFVRLHKPFTVGVAAACFIYQDLKPANIICSPGDYYTLIDFGAVTMRLDDKTTEPTAGCITAGYAAPEAAAGRECYIDPRFDLYSLGVTLWEAVTLINPQSRGEFPELSVNEMKGKGVSDSFIRLVDKALQRDPERRFSSAGEMRRVVMETLRSLIG